MQAPIRHLSEERKALERLIARAVITIVTLVALVVLVPVAWDKLSPFIVCVPVAAMLQPIIRFLQQKCHFRAAPAVLLPVLVVVAIACGVIYWFASFGLEQVANLIASAPTLISDTIGFIRAAFNRLIESMDTLPVETITWLQTGVEDALKWLSTNGMALVAQIASYAGKTAAGLPYAFVYLNFLVIGLYFVTKEYDAIRAKLPGGRAHDPNTNASRLTKAAVFGSLGYIRVQATYGLISLVVGWIYLQACGYPYAWLIACCAAFLEFLPLFGNGTLYIPWSIIAYVIGMNTVGTQILVLYLLLITFRRITEPRLMSANIGVSPLLSLVGMFVGMRIGGLLGLMGGPVVMTVLVTVVQGHYLDSIIRDIRLLLSYLRRRWDLPDPWADKAKENEDAAAVDGETGEKPEKPSTGAERPGSRTGGHRKRNRQSK